MKPLVECIPNFSEGRDQAVLDALIDAISRYPVHVLDAQRDPDHHRSVITFAGAPQAVADAMLSASAVAVERISLETHHGVHPRLGAVDVVPFVPIRDISMSECAELARTFGLRASGTLGLPVYLYEAAALRPERQSLPAVRGKGYEWLRTAILDDPSLAPDFGPSRLGPAGAMIVGARRPLIAINMYLDTTNLSVAQTVARAVRERDGGLPGVRALGLMVGGYAQVSCNLVDFQRTTLTRLANAVRQEARNLGVTVTRTELVGLVPRVALLAAGADALGLPLELATATVEERYGALTDDYRPMSFE
ncbi:MAG: glutamate formimidoyltransferase [Anaerolineae bacterium]